MNLLNMIENPKFFSLNEIIAGDVLLCFDDSKIDLRVKAVKKYTKP